MQQERRKPKVVGGTHLGSRPAPPADPQDRSTETVSVPLPARVAHLVTDRTEPSEHLFRRLLGAYLRGAAGIEISQSPRISPSTRNVVLAFSHRTRQPEIVSDDGRMVRLVDTSRDAAVSLAARIGKLGEEVLALHRKAADQWTRLPLRDEAVWETLDDAIDREAWFLQRAIAAGRADARTPGDGIAWWSVAHSLERIADYGVLLGQIGPRLTKLGPGSSTVLELRQLHGQALGHLKEALTVTSGHEANDLLDVGEALLASRRAISEWLLPAVGGGSMSPAAAVAIDRVLWAIEGTVRHTQEIAQAVLDRSLDDTNTVHASSKMVAVVL